MRAAIACLVQAAFALLAAACAQAATPAGSAPPAAVMSALRTTGLPASSFGFYARPVDAPRALAALNEEQPYQLASTTKVVTSLAALDLLGPDYRWRTYAFAKGEIRDGRLDGDLLIVGGGDAGLSSGELQQWFVRMRAEGLREIGGNIVLDRFAFHLNDGDHARTPKPDPARPHHVWPDAFTLDEGKLRIELSPGRGKRVELRMIPALAGVKLVNAVAAGGGCHAHAGILNQPGPLQLVVSGAWSAGCGVGSIQLVPLSHGEFTSRAVAGLWAEAGGTLRGGVVDKTRTPGSSILQRDGAGELELPWSVHLSQKLPQVVRDINKTSNNMAARNLLLTLSQGFPMQAATLDSARSRVQRWLRTQGLADGDIEIDNGSGLSRTERGKPRAMVQLLCRAWAGRSANAFVESLPIAGVDGTLAHRMQHGQATGNAFLKTGTLLDTRALAGYVKARSGRVYAVAAMVNHPDAARATPALDALIEWVAKNG